MTCHNCRSECRKYGVRRGLQRYQCRQCRKLYTEPHERLFDNMYTKDANGLLALRMLLEGNSIRSVERITDIHRDTIMRPLFERYPLHTKKAKEFILFASLVRLRYQLRGQPVSKQEREVYDKLYACIAELRKGGDSSTQT